MHWIWPVGLLLAAAIALLQGCVLLALFASLGRMMFQERSSYRALITEDGPPLETLLPHIHGDDARTGTLLDTGCLHRRKRVVLFLSPGCEACGPLLEAVRTWPRAGQAAVEFLLVVSGPAEEASAFLRSVPDVPLLADPEERIFQECGVLRTPLGLLVDSWGYVRMKGVVNNGHQLSGLIAGQGWSMDTLSWTPEVLPGTRAKRG